MEVLWIGHVAPKNRSNLARRMESSQVISNPILLTCQLFHHARKFVFIVKRTIASDPPQPADCDEGDFSVKDEGVYIPASVTVGSSNVVAMVDRGGRVQPLRL